MPVFFFDIHSGNELSIDDEGMELRDVLAAQVEAARLGCFRSSRDGFRRRARPTNGSLGARRARNRDGSQIDVRNRT